ncbi:MAG: efflux RND transporter periplasmic adaptor subunit [Candidatus Omnitrophota bacterium]|nr:efflux RND transporter periplasmic adaptor subunit [Candidatus Omnitrophota bacterium]
MKRTAIKFFGLLLMAAVISGCGKETGRMDKGKDEAIPVKVMKVRLENLDKTLEYVGNIKGRDEAIVYPKISGKIVEKVKGEGSYVMKGDAIAYIDRDEVGLKSEKAPVESPLTGTIGRIYVDIGSSVTPQTQVAFVADMDKAETDLNIPEKYLPMIFIDQEAEISVDSCPGEKFNGKVSMISPMIDLQTRTAPIEITIDNEGHRLQSGMFAKVKLILAKNKDVPIILKEAVMGKGADTYVYVVQGATAALKKIALGIRQGPYYEVRGGLKGGESVVIMGQQKLRDGAPVKAEE